MLNIYLNTERLLYIIIFRSVGCRSWTSQISLQEVSYDEERHILGINVSCFELVCCSLSCVSHLISVCVCRLLSVLRLQYVPVAILVPMTSWAPRARVV